MTSGPGVSGSGPGNGGPGSGSGSAGGSLGSDMAEALNGSATPKQVQNQRDHR
jgi:hypothetical protein